MQPDLAGEIRAQLRALEPVELDLEDQSAAHAGHAGAREGAHFRLRLVSPRFAGVTRVQRHRMVYDALAPVMRGRIHALTMDLRAPGE
jgi:BolA family transcriptional regulator, general stress-responsive regulator